jgi:RNA recognition motif-containing protein
VYISNLRSSGEDNLRAALEQFGNITDIFVKRRSAFGFASFDCVASAQNACDASPFTVGEDTCSVVFRQSKPLSERAPLESAPPSCNIYVNHLSRSTDKDTLRIVLEQFGEVSDLNVSKQGEYAFASFTSQEMSQAAVSASPITIGQDTCVIEMRRSTPRPNARSKGAERKPRQKYERPPLEQQLYIKGLASDASEDDIFDALSIYGEIQNVYRRKLRGEESGFTDYAFVTFSDSASVLSAAAAAGNGNVIINGSPVVGEQRKPRSTE